MKRTLLPSLLIMMALALSSCGAIPTLPPLEATVRVWTPQLTADAGPATATEQGNAQLATETPAESTSAPQNSPTATVEPSQTPVPPTWTPTATAVLTSTSSPTRTAQVTNTPTATASATPVPYSLQALNPYYLANFTHPDLACEWMGLAGQIFNRAGAVQKELLIKVGGELDGAPIVEQMTMPLSEPDIDQAYGPGGYELTLADKPVASDSAVWVQLFNLTGDPLSEQIFLTTYEDCQKNLILLNFVEK